MPIIRTGNSSNDQESERQVNTAKRSKVLLIVLSVSLVFAVGGLCVLGTLYIRASIQLSAQETNSMAFRPSNCDVNMIVFQGKRYFFSSDKRTWSSSRAFCALKGADLVTITSQSEQKFLQSNMNDWFWIGLSDLDTEGRWVWVNKQTLSDTGVQFWYKRQYEKNEPDNWKEEDSSGEHCAVVKTYLNYLDSWFDDSCKHTHKFICENKI